MFVKIGLETLRSSVTADTRAQALSLRQRDLEPGQLKAFQIVRPEPGEVSEVDMEIPLDDLAMYDDQYGSRVVRVRRYEIQLGVSSADLRLKTAVQVL
jgi:hypothetical protein